MNEVGLKDQCFGVEVELTGITREQAAQALADYFGTEPRRGDDYYDSWYVRDGEGKEWRLMSDSSIRGEHKVGARYTSTSDPRYRVEMVTPKLSYAELPKFQECIRRVRTAGGKVNSSCGIHVHVDAANHNRQSLKNLIGIMYSKEDILFKALQVNESRASRWCQKVREPMLQKARKLSSEETKNLTQLEAIWYEGDNGSTEHYGETDFLVLAPKLGIFALEVKRGRVRRENGIWYFTNRYGKTNSKVWGPFDQARDGIFSIVDAMKKRIDIEHRHIENVLFGYGVMFPDIEFTSTGIEEEQWQVFDSRDGVNVKQFIKRLSDGTKAKWESHYGPVNDSTVNP